MREVDLFVVHWNQPEACAGTVRALLAQDVPLRVTVVDNDSEADCFRRLESQLRPPPNLVRLAENRGWGGALNVVLHDWTSKEDNRYCFISAHDAIPDAGCLRLLIAAADADPRIGIACPQYIDPFVARLSRWRGVFPQPVQPHPDGFAQHVDVPHGTLMLLRRECLEQIGFFDERYFAYGDEHELGARAVRRGWRVVLVWGAIVTNPATSTASFLRSYLFARNSLLLVHDYFGPAAAFVRAALLLANTLRLWVGSRDNGFAFSTRARWQGVRDYFAGRFGRPAMR
jgi:N-acetylglucosaminyl-diphospho-decaprenol L-rhamnosyltransferase